MDCKARQDNGREHSDLNFTLADQRTGVPCSFLKSPILGKSLGKVDGRINCPVGGVIICPAQQTVPTDSKSTPRIIPFAGRFIPLGKTSACTRAIKAVHTFWL
jgi:hypothetical protein